ncbi:MAG: cob(I)yrinic acid a,c-diamide adenosyltransferase [Elusimicrobiota bacterium]
MPRITKVYTRTGDDGTTALGRGERVSKDSPRVEAYGTVDELSSQIGAALAAGLDPGISQELAKIQNDLFHLGSVLCVLQSDKQRLDAPQIEQRHVDALEALIDRLLLKLQPLENFILPGGSPGAAQLHVARAVCRRCERLVVALARREVIGTFAVKYLNRLSDALFVMARHENNRRGLKDTHWDSTA